MRAWVREQGLNVALPHGMSTSVPANGLLGAGVDTSRGRASLLRLRGEHEEKSAYVAGGPRAAAKRLLDA